MSKCRMCEREDNLVHQLCGFWFCFWCWPRAREKGAYYWACIAGVVGDLLPRKSKIPVQE